ncbi:hypothetical protein EDC04DRAFT_2717626 [Pisolithus marmoratus]|nr:hypothetical protein EDC04DRAFT_2717626 [Pisolithus marmoratus]
MKQKRVIAIYAVFEHMADAIALRTVGNGGRFGRSPNLNIPVSITLLIFFLSSFRLRCVVNSRFNSPKWHIVAIIFQEKSFGDGPGTRTHKPGDAGP